MKLKSLQKPPRHHPTIRDQAKHVTTQLTPSSPPKPPRNHADELRQARELARPNHADELRQARELATTTQNHPEPPRTTTQNHPARELYTLQQIPLH
jgi:hypothetical protein